MTNDRDRLLFISVKLHSFVRQDLEFLSERYEVKSFEFGIARGSQMFVRQFQLLLWVLRHIWSARYVYIWFGDYHALIPSVFGRLLRMPVFLVMAGYDAANLPDYSYGAFFKPIRGWFVKQNTRLATKIFPLSSFLVDNLEKNTNRSYGDKIKVVHLGGPVDQFRFMPEHPKDGSVICVSGGTDVNRMKIKGVDFYAEVARLCPETAFTVVGVSGAARVWLNEIAPDNLKILEWIEWDQLAALYSRASVVCQFSRFEGFGLVLLEGMLSECVPVSVDGIGPAEVIDESCGFLIPEYDPNIGAEKVREAVEAQRVLGPIARQRVLERFTMDHRIEKVLDVLEAY